MSYDDDQGVPWARGKTDAQLSRESLDGLRFMRRHIIYPWPGGILVCSFLFMLTQWVVFIAALHVVAVLWVFGLVGAHWDDPWAARARRAAGDWAASFFTRRARAPEGPGLRRLAALEAEDGAITLPRVVWTSPAVDEGHAQYRIQYERLVDLLPTLPRGIDHEERAARRATMLTLAEIMDGLHNYGDDPLERLTPPPSLPQGLFGASGAAAARGGFWALAQGFLARWAVYLVGGLFLWGSIGWGGLVLMRGAERTQRERADANYAAGEAHRRRADTFEAGYRDLRRVHDVVVASANAQSIASSRLIEARQRATRALARRERERTNAIANRTVDTPVDYEALLHGVGGGGEPDDGELREPRAADAPAAGDGADPAAAAGGDTAG